MFLRLHCLAGEADPDKVRSRGSGTLVVQSCVGVETRASWRRFLKSSTPMREVDGQLNMKIIFKTS